MFEVEWLCDGQPVERETSLARTAAEAVTRAKARAAEIATRFPGREPDSFRLIDAGSKREVGVYSLR